MTVLLSDGERAEIKAALAEENAERGLAFGVGTKLRMLALLWARDRRKVAVAIVKAPGQPAQWRQPLASTQRR